MKDLSVYRALSRLPLLNYRGKIIVSAFIGTHVPLIAIIVYVARQAGSDWHGSLGMLLTALVATLAGTAATLWALAHLLRPVILTSDTLRRYRETRDTGDLPGEFTDEAGTLMADARDTLEHLEEARLRLEFYDAATGLANRERLVTLVEERIAAGRPFALCAVALNCHARVATVLNAEAADRAARLMSQRLQDFLGTETELARIAPDRFAFLTGGADDASHDWAETLERVRDLLISSGAQLGVETITVQPHLSAGIARYPADAGTPEALIDGASAAASLIGTGTAVAFYSREARDQAVNRFRVEEDLRRALKRDEFELHYQPVVDLARGRTAGAEALIRWNHPERGLLHPALFIPVAEESGLISELGLWVMHAACAQLAEWQRAGREDLRVAVNLSAQQFHDPDLIDHVRAAFERNAVAPDQFEIELTESSMMDDVAHSRAVFGKLRDLGVSIAIDDFGTGFASLSYLRRLPFDKLKLDREFVSNVHETPGSQAICHSLIALARGLGLQVLAEGTETEDEIRYLYGAGCALFQGYYLSRPVPASDFPGSIEADAVAALARRLSRPGSLAHQA